MRTYVNYHNHSDYSLLDSCTDFKLYADYAKELGQTAIASTEHSKPLGWVSKKMYCDEIGIKFLMGVEIYLTETLDEKVRDNYHTILIAKNYDGIKELLKAVSVSCQDDHFYYTNRMTFDEFFKLSSNVIKISACLASPLNKLPISHPVYEKLVKHYDYLEIQPHNHPDQKAYNVHLATLSKKYNKPLIAGTDTHSLNKYKAECRSILLKAKRKSYGDEDAFDLTYKTYDELVLAFKEQDCLPESIYLQAIENTNVMADSVEDFELDTSLKYPILYGSREEDNRMFKETINRKFKEKVDSGVIPQEQVEAFKTALEEEQRVFKKIEMDGFMLSMSELISWCKENDIAVGNARGSVGGSRVAYVTDVIDLNPETWHTVFSRFANEDRKEVGDIDVDVITEDRPRIFEYIINRFGVAKTAKVPSFGTLADKSIIDEVGRAFMYQWNEDNGLKFDDRTKDNPFNYDVIAGIKDEFVSNPDKARQKYPNIFYYYDGLAGAKTSQSVHPAGMVISPIELADSYGVFDKDGYKTLMIDMEEIHECGLVKYDFLGLKNVQIIRDACRMAGISYPKSHEIDWEDQAVWADMIRNPVGIFQMEGEFAHSLLRQFEPHNIFDMSLVTACIRPSGGSYRNDLIQKKIHKNPSVIIDELLKDNFGYLVYQEDIIKFLQQICGLSGSDADNVRRAIGRKDEARLQKALPDILEGYCSKSDKPRNIAESEAKEFIQVIEDASSYMFGYNHSIAYCLIGYICAWLRYYHTGEFIATYLNCAANEGDITDGTALAQEYGIRISPPRFGFSKDVYVYDKENKVISKGIESVKYMNRAISNELYALKDNNYTHFVDLLLDIENKTSVNSRQLDLLIKIDYFMQFGNCVEILRINELFSLFKNGTASSIKKSNIKSEILENIVLDHSANINFYRVDYYSNKKGCTYKLIKATTEAEAKEKAKIKKIEKVVLIGTNGKLFKEYEGVYDIEENSYNISDMYGLLIACEDYIKSLNLKDLSYKLKCANQQEILGYIDLTTNNEEDRRKLMITKVVPLISKDSGEPWAYALFTKSVGSGKTSRLTLKANLYNNKPVRAMDIIYAKRVEQNKSGYWYLWDYEYVIE